MDRTAASMVWDQRVADSHSATPTTLFNDLAKQGIGPCTNSCTDTTLPPLTAERFWAKVAVAKPEECWLWIGAVSKNGYGSFGLKGKAASAHRVAYRLGNGALPDGLMVRHKCDVRRCVNPAHLETGTHVENARDMVERGGWKGGDQKGESNGRAILTAENVATIREMLARGRTNTAIGKEFGVHHATISVIRRGKSWKPNV